jgi:DNA repair protein RecN (Recombination protein N)
MLVELAVSDLGVIAELSLVLGPGTTALTGETGAGKTLVVGAIELLVGGRADTGVVRPGASEARVEGRFLDGDDEVVLARVVPADGRSRAYVDGRLAPVSALAERGRELVDLHGQHTHQALLGAATQRQGLDRWAGVDLDPLEAARARVATIDEALAALGGDARARAREVDLLRYQLDELESAGLDDPDEEAALAEREAVLADATAHREAATVGHLALTEDGGALDAAGVAVAAVAGRAPYEGLEQRLRSVVAELSEAAADLRAAGEAIEDDPEALEAVRARRHLLRELRRKYGDTLGEVIAFRDEVALRLEELESHEARAAELERRRAAALDEVATAAAVVAARRREAAPALAAAVEERLRELAMPRARVEIEVGGDDPADEVRFLLAANPGEPALPLAKVASGGELARTMLALRLALSGQGAGPAGTLVFDEVDAGIGGEAALAVGRALAALGADHQVLVVTHLPQVAAFADAQVAVSKEESGGRTVASARTVDSGDRVVELSRMLSGQPGSELAREHAEELLAVAAEARGRVR